VKYNRLHNEGRKPINATVWKVNMDEKDNFMMDVLGAITSTMAIPRKVVDNFLEQVQH
jgi:hypothetical protein